jgi:hypothetical protein
MPAALALLSGGQGRKTADPAYRRVFMSSPPLQTIKVLPWSGRQRLSNLRTLHLPDFSRIPI